MNVTGFQKHQSEVQFPDVSLLRSVLIPAVDISRGSGQRKLSADSLLGQGWGPAGCIVCIFSELLRLNQMPLTDLPLWLLMLAVHPTTSL